MRSQSPYHQLTGLSFSIYNAAEIQKLSVKEITNPQALDSLMHPTFGGLYDPALGPNDRNDVCTTCGLTAVYCPGHMGHIKLTLPVYNPVFFRTMIQILRGSCFNCHHLLAANAQVCLFIKQMELLDHGLLHQVYELDNIFHGLQAEWGATADAELKVEEGLSKYVTDSVTEMKQSDEKLRNHIKNVMEVRQSIVKEFLAEHFKPTRGKCRHCSKHIRPVRSEFNSKVFLQTDTDRRTKLDDLRNLLKTDKRKIRSHNVEEENKEEQSAVKASGQYYLTALEAREHLRKVWLTDTGVLRVIFRGLDMKFAEGEAPTDVFFLEVLPVPPSRFRPISQMGEKSFENGQTANLSRVLSASISLHQLLVEAKSKEKTQTDTNMNIFASVPGDTINEKIQNAWIRLQTTANCVVDSDMDKITPNLEKGSGIKQLLEKKEGLFRKHMMGKRVNYAARSVISPDPYINTNEIGVPDIFAKKLTYPQPVTPWNVQELRQAVINGPHVHPGASLVEDENGHKVILNASNKTQREAIAKQLLVSSGNTVGSKKVYRHLKNGDIMLINRQPTLHRPSIQAHRARILPGEKTLRLHYANCNAYNADFDGDEMNAHFPQNEIARSEAYGLAATDFQYLVPKNGLPLAGLIQDHIIAGVKLILRGRFFTRQDYQHLVFSALTDKNGHVKQLPPAILKPQPLWSGKQVFSTLLLNLIPRGMKPLNLLGKTKMSAKEWINSPTNPALLAEFGFEAGSMSESEVVVRDGQLLCGVMDKAHFGATPFGLVHCMYELYGGEVACRLLTCSARLFTSFLQLVGFTLGVEDILVTKEADAKRKDYMAEAKTTGPVVATKALNLEDVKDHSGIVAKYEEAHFSKDQGELKDLDLSMKGKTDEYQNKISKACIPQGLYKRFPQNNLQLMVCAGAKGSQVNCMQISCLLGQIELEGRRPPLMMSGRFLPSFLPYDTSPRAGGFVDGRFLTGIRPQEYFFHCMAGREGLIDTAVKTSRSGYLQRCIIKHLEGVVVNYDLTVRDSDGSIIQFQYGEDSIDIGKSKVLAPQHFPFLISNQDLYLDEQQLKQVEQCMDMDSARSHWKKIKKWKKKHSDRESRVRRSDFLQFCSQTECSEFATEGADSMKNGRSEKTQDLLEKWKVLEEDQKKRYKKHLQSCPSPLMSQFRPDYYFGSLSERLALLTDKYIKENPSKLIYENKEELLADRITADRLETLIKIRSATALAPPGEAVGLLAAQSIGEPSTQMTLNTFHFAGRGEMNVTLGIPRLREILMVASANIKTPTMDIPVLNTSYARKHANQLKKKLNKVFLSQVLEDVEVSEVLTVKDKRHQSRTYRIKFSFLPRRMYKDEFSVNPQKILKYMEKHFLKRLCDATASINAEQSSATLLSISGQHNVRESSTNEDVNVEPRMLDEEDFSDDDQNDGDATAVKHKERQQDTNEYMGEEEEREELVENEESDDEQENAEQTIDTEMLDEEMSEAVQYQHLTNLSKNKNTEMDQTRINAVVNSSLFIAGYTYDAKYEEWCEVTIRFGSLDNKVDMTSIVEQEAKKSVIYQVASISRCFLSESKKIGEEGEMRLKTEGVNIHEMYTYENILDLRKLYSNDIHAIARTYGIEAARTVIVKEITDVFAAYGIGVDYRHLSLVADYMTFEGCYKPFNRIGMESNASPLQKMSFETTMHFLKAATINGYKDELSSPSARLVVGRIVNGGTGSFELVQSLK